MFYVADPFTVWNGLKVQVLELINIIHQSLFTCSCSLIVINVTLTQQAEVLPHVHVHVDVPLL